MSGETASGGSLAGAAADAHRRVLVIDRDPALRTELSAALRRQSLVADEASSSREASELLAERSYAVVLLELELPDADPAGGIRAAVHESGGATPVVLLLAAHGTTVPPHLDPQRVQGVVRKPVDADDIAEVAAACIEIRGRGAFEAMAIATLVSGAPLLAFLRF